MELEVIAIVFLSEKKEKVEAEFANVPGLKKFTAEELLADETLVGWADKSLSDSSTVAAFIVRWEKDNTRPIKDCCIRAGILKEVSYD